MLSKIIERKLHKLLNAKCNISSDEKSMSGLLYSNIKCRLDGSSNPNLNADGTAKSAYTVNYLYIPKYFYQDTVKIDIDPRKVRRVWVIEGSVEDMARDLKVKQLVSNADSGLFCFLCEAGDLRDIPE
jgi:hypothetical protein